MRVINNYKQYLKNFGCMKYCKKVKYIRILWETLPYCLQNTY